MKKTIGLFLVIGLLVGLLATAALAATPGDGIRDFIGAGDGPGYAWGYVDANGDGVNDNFVDTDGDGVCDNFVDANGDGVNDLRGRAHLGAYGPCGGDGFVDTDGDGVCDNAGTGGGERRGGPGRNR